MISKKMTPMIQNNSAIRMMFEEGNRLARLYGRENVFDFSLGNPSVPAPGEVKEAILDILEQEDSLFVHGYMSNAGYEDVREAVAASLNRRFGTRFHKGNILMTVGAASGLNVILKTILDPGDEVMIPQPCYVSYVPCTIMADGVPVIVELKNENEFKLTVEDMEKKVTDRTKILVMPFPNNPTGSIMTRDDLEPVAEFVKKHDLYVISDEIYSELSYKGEHVSIASLPGMRERTIVINGFSKGFAMTGWRLGYCCGPEEILSQMIKLHQFAIMCAPTTSQHAAVEALRSCEEEVVNMREEYDMRRHFIVDGLNKLGLTCFDPEGAFYVFPSIQSTGLSSEDFCQKLLHAQRVAVVPGNSFGESGEGFVRISYAYSIEHLMEALKRIEAFLKTL